MHDNLGQYATKAPFSHGASNLALSSVSTSINLTHTVLVVIYLGTRASFRLVLGTSFLVSRLPKSKYGVRVHLPTSATLYPTTKNLENSRLTQTSLVSQIFRSILLNLIPMLRGLIDVSSQQTSILSSSMYSRREVNPTGICKKYHSAQARHGIFQICGA